MARKAVHSKSSVVRAAVAAAVAASVVPPLALQADGTDAYGNPVYSTSAGDAIDYQFLVSGGTHDDLTAVGTSSLSSDGVALDALSSSSHVSSEDSALDALFNSSDVSDGGPLASTPWRGTFIIVR